MDQAVALALSRNRAILSARLQVEDAELERLGAGIYANPELSYGLENFIMGDPNPEYSALHLRPLTQRVQSVGISQVLDVWFKHSLRVDAADKGVEQTRLSAEDAVRSIRYAVRSAFAQVLREQQESDFANLIRARYDDTVNLSRKRFAAGAIAENEFKKIELESLKYVNSAINAQFELNLARQELAELLAFDSSAELPERLPDEPLQRQQVDLPALTATALQTRPDLRAAKATQLQATLQLKAEEREPFPDVTLGVGYTDSKFQASGDNPHTLSLDLSIPVPLFDRNQAGIGHAQIAVRRAENAYALLVLTVRYDVSEAVRRLQRAQALTAAFEGGMLARAEQSLAVAEKSYKAGAISLLETLEAQRTYIELRASYLATLYDFNQAAIDVAFATGDNA